uniref:hypothetical protein n=1 Tax=Streptosporangium sp. CA-235898 TaxID=3240073 RepID=UPI003F49ACA9
MNADPILAGAQDLTDDALADVHRLHDIVHPGRPGGVHDPSRNPGGCDAVFCTMILPEVVPVVEPAIRADEARKTQDLADTLRASIATLNEQIDERGRQLAAASLGEIKEYLLQLQQQLHQDSIEQQAAITNVLKLYRAERKSR